MVSIYIYDSGEMYNLVCSNSKLEKRYWDWPLHPRYMLPLLDSIFGERAITALSSLSQQYDSIGELLSAAESDISDALENGGLGGEADCAAKRIGFLREVFFEILSIPLRNFHIESDTPELLSYLFARFSKLRTEQLCVIFLDEQQHMVGVQICGQGYPRSIGLFVRPILVSALEANASSCILAHNHPSGDAAPSRRDIAVTTRITRIADTLGLCVYDHLVLAGRKHSSFRKMGLL